jgi:hypothetical protein
MTSVQSYYESQDAKKKAGLEKIMGLIKTGFDISTGNIPGIVQDAAGALQKFQAWQSKKSGATEKGKPLGTAMDYYYNGSGQNQWG